MAPTESRARLPEGSLLWFVVTLIVGALLGFAVPQVFEHSNVLSASLATTVVLLAAILSYLVFDYGRGHTERVYELTTELNALRKDVGEPAELTIERFDVSTGEYFRRLGQVIEKLGPGDEVLIMTYHARPVEGDTERNDKHATARQEYLDRLLKKAAVGVVYRRLLCFESADGKPRVRTDFLRDHTRLHCLAMLALAQSRPGSVVVKKSPALLTADILIIKDCFGAISMETYAESARAYTAGALFVHRPPNGRIIDQLRMWWNEAFDKSDAITQDELEPASAEPTTVTPRDPVKT